MISKPLKELQNIYWKKTDRKICFLTFIIVYKSFRPITFLGEHFYFFNGFEISIGFAN